MCKSKMIVAKRKFIREVGMHEPASSKRKEEANEITAEEESASNAIA